MLCDGEYGIIERAEVENLNEHETTYNFEVEDFHTYYVGEGVLVHNKGCGDGYKNRPIAEKDGLIIDLEYGGSGRANLHLHQGDKKYLYDGVGAFVGAGRLNKTTFVQNGIKRALKIANLYGWKL